MRLLLRLGYLAIPLAFAEHWICRAWHYEPLATFALSGLAVVPLAQLMGEATGQLAERTGPTWGGLLNATFGNAAELIIAVIALCKGLNEVVKASLTGSILGNLLLVSGGAMLVGGWRRERQTFSRATAQTNSALLAVAVAGMLFPAIFHSSFLGRLNHAELTRQESAVSIGTAIVLLVVYGCGLLFTLRTHSHIFSPTPARTPEDPAGISAAGRGAWSVRRAVLALLVASVLVALVAELLVGSVEAVAQRMQWNPVFVGVILLAIFGNAAEQSTAVILARRNDMDTAMSITYQSSLQIALFTTPFVVLLSAVLIAAGVSRPAAAAGQLNLIFTPLEVAAVLLTVGAIIVIGLNGETNWFEGVLLLAVYAILGITFFYIPSPPAAEYDTRGSAVDGSDPAAARAPHVVVPPPSPMAQGTSHVTAAR